MSKIHIESLFGQMESRPRWDDRNSVCNHIIRVAFESAADAEFDYAVPDELWPVEPGQRVEVPFGKKNKLEQAFCAAVLEKEQSHKGTKPLAPGFIPGVQPQRTERKFKLKAVEKVLDKEPLLSGQLMELARWISGYYVCPLGQVLAAMVPGAVKKGAGEKSGQYLYLVIGDADVDELAVHLRGTKQKQIIKYLQQKKAFDSNSAVELQEVLQEAGCNRESIKKLAQKQIVKVTVKTILKALPAIPKAMLLRTERVILNEEQQEALSLMKEKLDSEKFGVTLLHGVTDSGKTELYIRAIEYVLQKGRTAIILLPEIALTAQTVQRFSSRFERIAVMHSALTAAQRNAQWHKIQSGEADVVIGARSAVFAPLSRIGLIVVDEEHEPSYKQDTAPRYHGRDVAIKRAQLANAHCILGSATPSLETLRNCQQKIFFSLVRLPRRVMNLPMPEMMLVDMRQQQGGKIGINLISEPLAEHLKQILAKNEQAIFLLNRRGYSNFIFCPSCRHTLQCRNCDVTLTFHKTDTIERMRTVTGKHISSGSAVCHYCLAQTLVPEKCPLCGGRFVMLGFGSQRLEEELAGKFPQVRVARVDSDSMAGKDYYRVLRDFSEGRIDVLAGTQMLAKGLHFPNVTLVGVISADTCLYLPDFRANERTFQLISQVAGRAGRSAKKGTVFVQTFLPDQPAIQLALKGDFDAFVEEELRHRSACNLPPFWRMAAITLRDMNFEKLELACNRMRQRIDEVVEQLGLKIRVRGPMPAAISRIQRFHRMQIVVQSPRAKDVRELFNRLRGEKPVRPAVKVAIDIDPVSLL